PVAGGQQLRCGTAGALEAVRDVCWARRHRAGPLQVACRLAPAATPQMSAVVLRSWRWCSAGCGELASRTASFLVRSRKTRAERPLSCSCAPAPAPETTEEWARVARLSDVVPET